MKATRHDIGSQMMQDIEWQRERDCAKRKQRYLKHLREIHKKKAAPNSSPESGTDKNSLCI